MDTEKNFSPQQIKICLGFPLDRGLKCSIYYKKGGAWKVRKKRL